MVPISKCIRAISKARNGRERWKSRIVCTGLVQLSGSMLVFFSSPFHFRNSVLSLKRYKLVEINTEVG